MTAPRRRRLAATILAVLVATAGCTRTAAAPAAPSAQPGFGGVDRSWIEINIAMDEEILPLLALVPTHGRDPALRALAQRVSGFTGSELSTLRSLHDRAGMPSRNPHEGMAMPGLLSPAQVTQAGKMHGAAFDAYAAEQVTAFLEQGRALATGEQQGGADEQTKALAQDMVQTRNQTLAKAAG